MFKHDHSRRSASAAFAGAALCALAVLGGRPARAQVSALTSFSQLTSPVKTSPYPQGPLTGPSAFVVPQTFTVAAGDNSVSFTATNGTADGGFESSLSDPAFTPQFSDPNFGGAPGDVLENTTYTGPTQNTATGPLLIQFQNPIAGFGLLAQDSFPDTETFTLNVFADRNATVLLGSFTYPAVDNTGPVGTAVFVGAQSDLGLPLFESAILSSSSTAGSSNDYFFGPTQVQGPAPVPEASTVVGFSIGVFLFVSLALRARKRPSGGAA